MFIAAITATFEVVVMAPGASDIEKKMASMRREGDGGRSQAKFGANVGRRSDAAASRLLAVGHCSRSGGGPGAFSAGVRPDNRPVKAVPTRR